MPCSGLKILVIDDHDFQRRILCQLFETLGAASVSGASSGEQALRELEEPEACDLVVLDLMMPGMDGMEFMRHLSQIAPGLPVLVSSACDASLLASVQQVAQVYDIRLLGLLQKPITAAGLTPLLAGLRAGPSAAHAQAARFSLREIADAWSRNEFHALFEPTVDLTTGAVASVDVSPAWQHPTLGLLAASQFLPCIEARGLAGDFALLMLEQGMARCRKLRQRGLALTVSTWLPAECLVQGKLVDRIHRRALDEEVEPAWVTLHVAGAAPGGFLGMELENLARLRMRGFEVGIAVPDLSFGACDSPGLAPFSEVRVRRNAFSAALRDPSSRMRLARRMGEARKRKVRTVGAGIASKDEWTLLQEAGCELAQGPFVSQPLPGRAVQAWLAAREATTIR